MALVLIVALPLAGWLVNGLAGGRLPRPLVSVLGCGTVAASFVASAMAARHLAVTSDALTATLFTWIAAGDFTVSAGLLMDRLSALMALVVTGVGFLIHVYSIGYMADDSAYSRYFAYLNLFVGSMLLLVLGGNLLVLFVGWELVGLCSYLLIGFWFDRERAANAGRKAFVVNRIGDAGFLLGILLLATTAGTLQFDRLADAAGAMAPGLLTATTLLLFMGATGKSAQLPLYVWLPDAMEGPTPVSALIHAATMVTAGVYMIARLHPLFLRADFTLSVVAAVGAATAFFAATIALVEWDLKRVLAYSAAQHGGSVALWLAGLLTAYVTAVYITRAAVLTFFAPAGQRDHPHEAPASMGGPMAILALLSFGGGWVGAHAAGAPLLRVLDRFFAIEPAADTAPGAPLTAISVAVGVFGIITGLLLYRGRREVTLGALGAFLARQWHVDALYDAAIVTPAKRLARFAADVVETRGIDGAVNGIAGLVGQAGVAMRRLQTGYVRNYAAAILAGTILILSYWLWRGP